MSKSLYVLKQSRCILCNIIVEYFLNKKYGNEIVWDEISNKDKNLLEITK